MFLPEFDRDYLVSKGFQFEEKIDSVGNCLIVRNYELPIGKFNNQRSDLLILIPPGYPDTRPDMWYFYPAILLSPSNISARQTQTTMAFEDRTWQRWSRHFPPEEWKSGEDGIYTYLKKIYYALETAS